MRELQPITKLPTQSRVYIVNYCGTFYATYWNANAKMFYGSIRKGTPTDIVSDGDIRILTGFGGLSINSFPINQTGMQGWYDLEPQLLD